MIRVRLGDHIRLMPPDNLRHCFQIVYGQPPHEPGICALCALGRREGWDRPVRSVISSDNALVKLLKERR